MDILKAIGGAFFVCLAVAPAPGPAQSVDLMLGECASVAQTYFRDWEARTEMRYNGQRVDGTHAINGRIFQETRYDDFACSYRRGSYRRGGRRMVEFFAEGRLRNAYLPGPQAADGSDIVRVNGVPVNDVLNVRAGPGTGYRVVGALSNGTSVRNLVCQAQGPSRWCQIEMMTEMRERGWVNARYLTQAAAALPPDSPGGSSTERVRFAPGTTGAELRGTLAPGESQRYVLGARNGQDLNVRLSGDGGRVFYQIFNPDGSFLLDQVPARQIYRGQLWQSGDHVIEVINRANRPRGYDVSVRIR